MPKAILEFNLPEENSEFKEATNACSFKAAIQDFDNFLRSKLKYDDSLTDAQYKIYDEVRTKLYEELNDNDLTLFE